MSALRVALCRLLPLPGPVAVRSLRARALPASPERRPPPPLRLLLRPGPRAASMHMLALRVALRRLLPGPGPAV
eukprot:9869380-Alexandrium_andersonii.AAC.1